MTKTITQFKPGQSGNPAGRPKGSSERLVAINAIFQVLNENKEDFLSKLREEYKRDALSFYKKYAQPIQPKNYDIDINESPLSLADIIKSRHSELVDLINEIEQK